MNTKEKELREVLTELTHKERRARNRALFYVIIPLFIGGFLFIFSLEKVNELENQSVFLGRHLDSLLTAKKSLEQQIGILNDELNEITNTILAEIKPFANQTVEKNRILESVSDKRKEVIRLAFELQERVIPFKWGGKSPKKGFDSSGFVAYLLSQVNIIQNPEIYWSGRLRSEFGNRSFNSGSELQIGDIIFYEAGVCMLYLGNNRCIGMLPQGIVIKELYFGFKKLGYGRVNYSSSEDNT